MSTARIYKKGQVTIPKAVRDAVGLDVGDPVVVEAWDGEVVARRPRGVLEFDPSPSCGGARERGCADRAGRDGARGRVLVLESAEAGYGWDRDAVARAVEAIVDEPAFAVEHAEALRVAAATYRDRSIDLHDCYLDAVARAQGTRVSSSDHDFGSEPARPLERGRAVLRSPIAPRT